MIKRYIYGPWTPDQPPSLSTGLQTALNVYPTANGYRPIPEFVPQQGGDLGGMCFGAASFVGPQGQSNIIAGTASSLYRAQATGWQQIGTGYTLQSPSRWRFVQFGGIAVATNDTNAMAKIDLTTLATSPLAGSPPRTRMLAVVKDFLVAGVIDGDVQKLQWSGINNAEWWTVGQNQADFQIMPSGGEITGIFGGEVGIVLQRGRISRMTYVGDNIVFQFDEVSSNTGCVAVNSTAQWGGLGFFLSDNGFMMWDGGALKPIGQERVDRYFKSLYGKPSFDKMSTAIDPVNTLVAWSMGDRIFLYNWTLDRWSLCDFPASIILPGFTRNITLDELDVPYPDLDAMPISLDDPSFIGGNPTFYLFSSANILGNFTGPTMFGEIAMARVEPTPGRTARLRFLRTVSDCENAFILTVGTARRLGEELRLSSYTNVMPSGDMPTRDSGRFFVLGQQFEGASYWTFAQGLEAQFEPGPRV